MPDAGLALHLQPQATKEVSSHNKGAMSLSPWLLPDPSTTTWTFQQPTMLGEPSLVTIAVSGFTLVDTLVCQVLTQNGLLLGLLKGKVSTV